MTPLVRILYVLTVVAAVTDEPVFAVILAAAGLVADVAATASANSNYE